MVSYDLCQELFCASFSEEGNDLCGKHGEDQDDGKILRRKADNPRRGRPPNNPTLAEAARLRKLAWDRANRPSRAVEKP